jgi:hypothetical protein
MVRRTPSGARGWIFGSRMRQGDLRSDSVRRVVSSRAGSCESSCLTEISLIADEASSALKTWSPRCRVLSVWPCHLLRCFSLRRSTYQSSAREESDRTSPLFRQKRFTFIRLLLIVPKAAPGCRRPRPHSPPRLPSLPSAIPIPRPWDPSRHPGRSMITFCVNKICLSRLQGLSGSAPLHMGLRVRVI